MKTTNKFIHSNLKIQLRNYSETNFECLALREMQK